MTPSLLVFSEVGIGAALSAIRFVMGDLLLFG